MRDEGIDRLRVVLVTDAVGGVWDYALTLAGGLLRGDRADVLLVSVGPPPDASRLRSVAAIDRLQLEVLDGRLDWMEGGQDWLEAFRRQVTQLAEQWNASVVHVNQLGLAAIEPVDRTGRRLPVLLGVHSDLVTWWKWVEHGGDDAESIPEYLNWQRDLAWSALRQADAIVCPSFFLADEVTRAYALERPPTAIHNGVMSLPEPPESIGRAPRLAAVVGRAWDEAKNVSLVADVLRTSSAGWEVVVAGDLAEPGRAPVPAHQAPGLQYAGFLDKDHLSRLFRRASLFIAPSRYEPFGLAAVEAALSGCAIVANDLPSYREVWGDAAAFFARNDARSLATCLDRLAADPAEVARRAHAAYERASSRYSVEQMVARYTALYRNLLWTSHSEHLQTGALTHHR